MCGENEFLFRNENVSHGVLELHRDKSVTLICLGCCFLPFHLFPGCLLAKHVITLFFVAARASRGPFVPRNQAQTWMQHPKLMKGTNSSHSFTEHKLKLYKVIFSDSNIKRDGLFSSQVVSRVGTLEHLSLGPPLRCHNL